MANPLIVFNLVDRCARDTTISSRIVVRAFVGATGGVVSVTITVRDCRSETNVINCEQRTKAESQKSTILRHHGSVILHKFTMAVVKNSAITIHSIVWNTPKHHHWDTSNAPLHNTTDNTSYQCEKSTYHFWAATSTIVFPSHSCFYWTSFKSVSPTFEVCPKSLSVVVVFKKKKKTLLSFQYWLHYCIFVFRSFCHYLSDMVVVVESHIQMVQFLVIWLHSRLLEPPRWAQDDVWVIYRLFGALFLVPW